MPFQLKPSSIHFQVKRWGLLMIMWLWLIMFDYVWLWIWLCDYVWMAFHSTPGNVEVVRVCMHASSKQKRARCRGDFNCYWTELGRRKNREWSHILWSILIYNGQAGFKQERARLRNEFNCHWTAWRWRKRLITTEENGFAEKKGLSKDHKTKIWYKRGSDTISGSSDLVFMSSPLRGQWYFLCSKMKPNDIKSWVWQPTRYITSP